MEIMAQRLAMSARAARFTSAVSLLAPAAIAQTLRATDAAYHLVRAQRRLVCLSPAAFVALRWAEAVCFPFASATRQRRALGEPFRVRNLARAGSVRSVRQPFWEIVAGGCCLIVVVLGAHLFADIAAVRASAATIDPGRVTAWSLWLYGIGLVASGSSVAIS